MIASGRPGTVYIVGAGPGDPGLLTVRGQACLAAADVVLYDRLSAPELLSHCRPEAELIDVGKTPGRPELGQARIHELLVEHAHRGQHVVRLKGGDPYVFGRGAEEVSACRAAGVPCTVVPGVTSATAVPAAAGIPVTYRNMARSFAVVTGRADDRADLPPHDFQALARVDTLVVLMGRANLRQLTAALLAVGRAAETPAAAIASGTTPRQRTVVATLGTIADAVDQAELATPVVTVIGETARFAEQHTAGLMGADAGCPLAGRRIAVTQAVTSSSELRRLLSERGAAIVDVPLIRISYPQATELDPLLPRLRDFDWILFTSQHAVRGFWRRLEQGGLDARALGGCQVAAIGPGTARELGAHGITPDTVPEVHMARGLLETLRNTRMLEGLRILFPHGNQALGTIPDELRAAGASVQSGVVYQTEPALPAPWALANLRAGVDALLFCSPSAVRQFKALGLDPGGAVVGYIGETTARAAAELGLPVQVVPENPGSGGLIAALERYFAGVGVALV
jgi:uroporphyrinogen III methyltransferase/synthase